MMHEIDKNLLLLSGEAWEVKGVGYLYPPTLKDIAKIGFTKYNQYVNLMLIDAKEIIDLNDESEEGKKIRLHIDNGDILGFDCIFKAVDKTIANLYKDAIKFFFKVEDVYYSEDQHMVYLIFNGLTSQKHVIDRNSYELMKPIVKIISCRDDESSTRNENPADERAAKIIEKLNKSREKLKQIKAYNENDGIDLSDIISSVSTRSNSLNKITVWDLTLYQLFDEFKRLQFVDQYETGVQAMMQIGDKAKFKHWSRKMTDQD